MTHLDFQDCIQQRHIKHEMHMRTVARSFPASAREQGLKPSAKVLQKGGLTELAQAVRRLSGLRELNVESMDKGHVDFLLTQVLGAHFVFVVWV